MTDEQKLVDMVNHPPHYNKPGKIECIKCIEAITDDILVNLHILQVKL